MLNTKCKDCKSSKNLGTRDFMYTKKLYAHEIVQINKNLTKIYLLKNAKKTCEKTNAIVIGRFYRYQFKCNYLKYQKNCLNFLLYFWNLH